MMRPGRHENKCSEYNHGILCAAYLSDELWTYSILDVSNTHYLEYLIVTY